MFCSVLLSVWIVQFVRSKYFPHHPILEHLQPLFVRQLGRPRFKPHYATSGVSIDLSYKGHTNNKLFAGKKKLYTKINHFKLQLNVQSVFLHLIHKRYDTFLRPSQYFLYIYERCITLFRISSQVPPYSTLHQPPANTLHVLLTITLYTDVKDI